MNIFLVVANIVLVGFYVYICTKIPARIPHVAVVILCAVAVYLAHVLLTIGYGELRFRLANTDERRAAMVGGDGVKVALSIVFIGPIVCGVAGALGSVVFFCRVRAQSLKSLNSNSIYRLTDRRASANPYEPPG